MIIYIKSYEEIDGFKRAGNLAAYLLNIIEKNSVDGISTLELDKIAERELNILKVKSAFYGYNGFPGNICLSLNNIIVHGVPTSTIIKNGDVLKIDVGVDVDGFIGDTAKTIRIGGMREDDCDRLILNCHQILLKAIEQAKPGCSLMDIGKAIFQNTDNIFSVIKQYGGHGIDRYVLHSDPFVYNYCSRKNNFILKQGMILAIEPMLVLGNDSSTSVLDDGWSVLAQNNTAHFEHTVLVDCVPQILTKE
jgi:methionyl aminopeptidase